MIRSHRNHLPVTPLQAGELAGVDEYALADLAFLDLDIFFLAVRSLAAGLLGSRDFWYSQQQLSVAIVVIWHMHILTDAVRHVYRCVVKLWGCCWFL